MKAIKQTLPYLDSRLFLLIVLLLLSSLYNYELSRRHKLEYDEIYVLARANGKTINPLTKAFPFDLKKIYTLEHVYKELENDDNNKEFFKEAVYYFFNYPKFSNHPPINDLVAKFFIWSNNSFMNLRYCALFSFFILLLSIFYFQKQLNFTIKDNLFGIAIFSLFSQSAYMAIFPKGYSLSIAFYLLTLAVILRGLKEENQKTSPLSIGFHVTITTLVAHLAVLTHFMMGLYIPVAIAILWFASKYVFKFRQHLTCLASLSTTILSFVIYLPIIKKQADSSINHFQQHHGLQEFLTSIEHFNTICFFNYKVPLMIIVALFLLFTIFKQKQELIEKEFLVLAILFIFPFILGPIIDIIANKNFMNEIRFVLISLPLYGMILGFLFRNSPVKTALLLGLLGINLYFPHLQKLRDINRVPLEEISKGYQAGNFAHNERTIIIIENLYGRELNFLHHLTATLLRQHPLAKVNLLNSNTNKKLRNIFIATNQVNQQGLLTFMKKHGIKKIIITTKKFRLKTTDPKVKAMYSIL